MQLNGKKIDQQKAYVLGGKAVEELIRSPKIEGVQGQVNVETQEDGTRVISLASPSLTTCHLRIFDARLVGSFGVKCSFGTIARRRPTGFNTQGMITALPVANDAAEHHFFAKATIDPLTLQWTEAEIVEADWDVVNTNTEHYTLKGIAEVIAGVLVVSPPICGDVEPDPCQLANDITPP